MKQTHLELRVGTFVAIAVTFLAIGILFFGNKSTWAKGYDVWVHFNFTNGVEAGAPVRFSGVNIGQVKDIRIMEDGRTLELCLFINEGVVLREDVSVYVNTLGVMGEKYIEFMGGSAQSKIIQENGPPLRGTDPIAVNDMAKVAQNIAEDLGGLVKSLQTVLGNEETQEDLRETIRHAKESTKEVGELSKTMNTILAENKEGIHQTITQMNAAAAGIEKNMAILDGLLQGVKDGKGLLGQVLTDEDLYRDMEELMADIKAHPWKLLIKTRDKKVNKTQINISSRKRS